MKELKSVDDALQEVNSGMRECGKSGRFVAVLGWIDDEDNIQMQRNTFKFPGNRLAEFASEINKNLIEEAVRCEAAVPPKEPEPLPRRSPFRPPAVKSEQGEKGEDHAAEND